jgi:hypothetical protein
VQTLVQVRDGQHLTLTTEQIKRMPWEQHARIWKVHPAACSRTHVRVRVHVRTHLDWVANQFRSMLAASLAAQWRVLGEQQPCRES